MQSLQAFFPRMHLGCYTLAFPLADVGEGRGRTDRGRSTTTGWGFPNLDLAI